MSISGKEIALILSDHFDAAELDGLRACLSRAGALISIVGDKADQTLTDWNKQVQISVGVSYEEAHSYNFDAVIISDGYTPDDIRASSSALSFIRDMYDSGKIVGAIHHGVQVLISLDILKNKNVTGWPSIRIDLENAGATYYDEPVVIDGNLVTGRGPSDLEAFCDAIIDELRRLSEYAA
ncbi:MAG: DJ-1/PfpI family protein [Actinomycetota bacterium]|nr:DJ-1/PfpI family protein [Actinomycetota bacterium]